MVPRNAAIVAIHVKPARLPQLRSHQGMACLLIVDYAGRQVDERPVAREIKEKGPRFGHDPCAGSEIALESGETVLDAERELVIVASTADILARQKLLSNYDRHPHEASRQKREAPRFRRALNL